MINRLVVIAVLGIFVWMGASRLSVAIKHDRGHLPLAREISADLVFGKLGSTELIERSLEQWPQDSAFLLVAPDSNPNTIKVFFELSILVYPRRISTTVCATKPGSNSQRMYTIPPSKNLDGLIFYDMPPSPSLKPGQLVAPKLYVVPYKGSPEWNSFCP